MTGAALEVASAWDRESIRPSRRVEAGEAANSRPPPSRTASRASPYVGETGGRMGCPSSPWNDRVMRTEGAARAVAASRVAGIDAPGQPVRTAGCRPGRGLHDIARTPWGQVGAGVPGVGLAKTKAHLVGEAFGQTAASARRRSASVGIVAVASPVSRTCRTYGIRRSTGVARVGADVGLVAVVLEHEMDMAARSTWRGPQPPSRPASRRGDGVHASKSRPSKRYSISQ